MKNKICCIVLALLITIAFSGCQLAREDLLPSKENNRLIGVFVSYDYIDLFDMESYLNDNINKFSNGGNIQINDVNDKYNNRLYAKLVEKEMTATGGEKYTNSEYIFDGLDGITMFSPRITDPITGNSYISSGASNGISDMKSNYKSTDNEEKIELEGTIYLSSGAMSSGIYINPVYQSEDGKVYLKSGHGFMTSGDNGEGGVYSQTITDSSTKTEGKKSTTYSTQIKLSVATMNPTEKVLIYQMDNKNNIITKDEYVPDNIIREITPDNSCEYLIVENHKISFNGEKQVERQIFSKKIALFIILIKPIME